MSYIHPRFIFFTNIPTPYRTSFYNSLAAHRDFDFVVYYMRKIEADRSWNIDLASLKHRYLIDAGLYRMFGRYHLHVNPVLITKMVLAPRNTEIIVGGAWNDINVLILVVLKRLGILRHRLHFWSEANYLTIGASNDNIFKRVVRKFVYHCNTGVQFSSGHMTEITMSRWNIRVNKFISLPNTIEDDAFIFREDYHLLRSDNKLPIFLIPARVHEIVKGIKNFFIGIGENNLRKCQFIVAGDGPDLPDLANFVNENKLSDNILLTGHCTSTRLAELYATANVFVLGSFTDASPLTVVEALRMKLPLLISERCGNHFEAVDVGRNGYLFNPYNHAEIKAVFEAMLERKSKWRDMGNISGIMYEKNFKKSKVVSNFVKEFNSYCRRP